MKFVTQSKIQNQDFILAPSAFVYPVKSVLSLRGVRPPYSLLLPPFSLLLPPVSILPFIVFPASRLLSSVFPASGLRSPVSGLRSFLFPVLRSPVSCLFCFRSPFPPSSQRMAKLTPHNRPISCLDNKAVFVAPCRKTGEE